MPEFPNGGERLKIAIQKSGRLTEASLELLSRCGLKYSRGKDQLMCHGENMPLDVLFVRDDDIPDLVQEDVCDLGLVGLNVVEEKRLSFRARNLDPLFETVRTMDFGRCKLCIAVPDHFDYRGPGSLRGKRIATTYPNILGRFLQEQGVSAEVVVLSGSVEIAPRLGRADVICDLVSTGSTLAANHLRQAQTVLESQAVLIRTPIPIAPQKQEWARRLLMRIDGVEQVKGSKYIMLHAPRSALPAITRLLPGSEAPTVLPLEGRGDLVAVHAVCPENVFWETLEDLKSAGCQFVAGTARRKDARLTMRIIDWQGLDAAEQRAVLARPAQQAAEAVSQAARTIIQQVRRDGDAALRALTLQFDGVALEDLAVGEAEITAAQASLTPEQHAAIDRALDTVRLFHAAQQPAPIRVETSPGVICERIHVPIGAVGLYVPAGSAPLPSTAIMLGVPAALAACPVRVLCTAPMRDGNANPAVVVAARRAGISQIFKIGGAQAIAAMAYGTASVPKCDKVFGPGNAYVTAAKMLAALDPEGAAADLPAGPSEVLVIADDSAHARFVAADLLAQAEHSPDAQALLVSTSTQLAGAVAAEIERQARQLSRGDILAASMQSMRLIVVAGLSEAFEIANRYAAEHLILEIRDARSWLPLVTCAGAVFLGHWSPESMGDYCSGPNHTLPTYGYARAYSGLSLEDFQKRITVQELSHDGLRDLGPTAQTLARLEGLDGHAAAVTLRLEALA